MHAKFAVVALGLGFMLAPGCGHFEANDDIVPECGTYREAYRRCFGDRQDARDAFRSMFKVDGKSEDELAKLKASCSAGATHLGETCR